MKAFNWSSQFKNIHQKTLKKFSDGDFNPGDYFSSQEQEFLDSIGCTPHELFDFAEDWFQAREPDFETVLLITATRRDYFWVVQKGRLSGQTFSADDFPAASEALGGVGWLPRIIKKAQAKLSGQLPTDMMYCCGGDRKFLKSYDIHPADFLRVVWAAEDNHQKILDFVKGTKGALFDGVPRAKTAVA